MPVSVSPETVYAIQPGKGSFVDATVYSSPNILAAKLLWYQNNLNEYLKFFEYREKERKPAPLLEQLQRTSVFLPSIGCRICACKFNEECMTKPVVNKCGYSLRK